MLTLDAALAELKIYTMAELNQNTAHVLNEINDAGRPAAVTKHGRFVALITPLRDAKIESVVLSQGPLANEIEARATDLTQVRYTPEELTARVIEHYSE